MLELSNMNHHVAGKTAMVTPTGQAPHIPFHLGPTQAVMDTPTPTDGMPGFGGAGASVQPPPGLGLPPGLPQPTSNMHAAQQLKGHLMKGKSATIGCAHVDSVILHLVHYSGCEGQIGMLVCPVQQSLLMHADSS